MIKYYVDKENRTVIAKFNVGQSSERGYWQRNILKEIIKLSRCCYMFDDTENQICNAALNRIDNNIYGVAKCSPDDMWDEETGKTLAKKRLLRKWKLARLAAFEAASNKLSDALTDINKKRYSLISQLDKSKTQPGIEVNIHTN
jgi:hypothetical protein